MWLWMLAVGFAGGLGLGSRPAPGPEAPPSTEDKADLPAPDAKKSLFGSRNPTPEPSKAAPPPPQADSFAGLPIAVAQRLWALELQRAKVAEFVPYLQDTDPKVRARALLAVGRLRDGVTEKGRGPTAALRALELGLEDTDVSVRLAAAFGTALTPGSAAMLMARLPVEEDHEVRSQIFRALGEQGAAEVVLTLRDALGGPEASAAALALGRLGMRQVQRATDEDVIGALVGVLRNPVAPARQNAAWALARLGATAARPELRAALQTIAQQDYDPQVRAWLVRAWAGVALPGERLEGLPALLADRDPGVRIAAARAVGKYGCADRPSLLEPLLKDEVPPVRQEAYAAAEACPVPTARLTELLGQHDALDDAALVEVLARRHELPDPMSWLADTWPLRVRVAALGAVRDRSVLMEWALNGEDAAMRSTAVTLLVEQATQAELLRLVAASDEAVVETAAEELKKRPDPKAEEPLLAVLGRERLEASTAGACLRALSVLYFTGKVPKVSPLAAERVQRQLQAWPKLRGDVAPIAGLLGIKLPEAAPMEVPELAEILDMRALRIQTEAGEIRVELWPEVAPYTVYNFVRLAEKGYFDGLSFHRVVPEFVVQTGDPRGDGWGGPGYAIPDELNPAPYEAGVLGMALSGPDTGGSQWFITLRPQPHLDGAYTAFGRVTLGLDHARRVMAGDQVQRVIVERVQPVAGYAFP